MSKLLAGTAILAALAATPAAADPVTGHRWLEYCEHVDLRTQEAKNPKSSLSVGSFSYCLGFTLAVIDTAQFVSNANKTKTICAPGNINSIDLMEIGKSFLLNNPEQRKWLAAVSLSIAFKEAFPCDDLEDTKEGAALPLSSNKVKKGDKKP